MLGQIEAINLVDLELRLKRMGLDLVRGGPNRHGGSLLRSGEIKRAELINFCFHMEQLIAAGVPLVESLIDLRDSIENARFREVMSGVIESIQGGLRLSQGLAQYPQIFNPVFSSLIRAGEDTGKLSEVLKSLVENLKWEDELAEHMKKLVLYPAFVGSIVILVTFFLMIYLVPQMVSFIKNMGQQIPPADARPHRSLGVFRRLLVGSPRRPRDRVRRRQTGGPGEPLGALSARSLPSSLSRWRARFLRKIILSRFASIFALMYSSGITILDAIRSSEEITGNMVIQEGLRLAGQQIGEGKERHRGIPGGGAFPAARRKNAPGGRGHRRARQGGCSTCRTSTTAKCAKRSARSR